MRGLAPGSMIISALAAALGVYMAHNKRRNTVLWGLLCFFFPPATIILAFLPMVITREDVTQCPKCSGRVLKGSPGCPRCGEQMPIDMVECGSCGKFVPEGSKCSECGSPLR